VDFTESIKLDPHDHMIYFRRGRAYSRNREFEKAILDYNDAIRLNPNEATPYDCLAWLLATCSVDALRDGKRAVELAATACELTEWKMDIPIDTLAAACAESGDFEEAVKRQQQAIDLLDKEADKTSYEIRLNQYKNRQPYRQTPESGFPEKKNLGDT
jgi:Flp pilus assembly protein TadD